MKIMTSQLLLPLESKAVSECARPSFQCRPHSRRKGYHVSNILQLQFRRLMSPEQHVLDAVWSYRGLQGAVCVPWESVPVSPQEGQQEDEEEGGEGAWACLHQGDHTVGHSWNKDQKDSHEGQQHIDKFSQEGSGRGIFQPLQLDDLLLLLLELHLRDSGLTRLQCFLQEDIYICICLNITKNSPLL